MSVVNRGVGSLKKVSVKPIMSINQAEARRRVLTHYKQWYRAAPTIVENFKLPYTIEKVRAKIREEFLKNSHVQDIRVIDMLIIKGEMDLQETILLWKQDCHVMEYFDKETAVKEPSDFLGKFFAQK